MNHKTTDIEKRIKELLPELMVPTFGCRVRSDFFDVDFVVVGIEDRKLICKPIAVSDEIIFESIDIKHIEIIGHPITDTNLLKALLKSGHKYCLCGFGQFYRFSINSKGYKITTEKKLRWKQRKPFSEQSEELKQFVGDLLFK